MTNLGSKNLCIRKWLFFWLPRFAKRHDGPRTAADGNHIVSRNPVPYASGRMEWHQYTVNCRNNITDCFCQFRQCRLAALHCQSLAFNVDWGCTWLQYRWRGVVFNSFGTKYRLTYLLRINGQALRLPCGSPDISLLCTCTVSLHL